MIGVPAGIQNAIFAIANLFVQSGVNSFDTYMVSGNAAATNADTIIYNVMYAFYIACSGNRRSRLLCFRQFAHRIHTVNANADDIGSFKP